MAIEITPEIQMCLDQIFGAVIIGGLKKDDDKWTSKMQVFKTAISKFKGVFPQNIFVDEYAFFYSVLTELKTPVFSVSSLDLIVENNRDVILDSEHIDIAKWSMLPNNAQATDSEKVIGFLTSVKRKMIELSNSEVTMYEFDSSCEMYLRLWKNQYMQQTVQNMALILSEYGYDERDWKKRKTTYKGMSDARKYYSKRMSTLNSMEATDRVKLTVLNEKWLEESSNRDEESEKDKVITFGLTEIDNVIGHFMRSNLLAVLGPPKSGKTRVSAYLAERSLQAGFNVLIWPVEGAKNEWEQLMLANQLRTSAGVKIDSAVIRKNDGTDDVKKLVNSARVNLALDQSRGRLAFIDGTLYLEEFLDTLKTTWDVFPYDVVIIDSLLHTLSKTGRGKVDRIGEAFVLFKDFCKNGVPNKVFGIVPTQMTRDAISQYRKNPDGSIDVTAGGETSESIRTPDFVIGVISTKEERMAGRIKLCDVANRHGVNFMDFYCKAELGSCYLESDPSLNM